MKILKFLQSTSQVPSQQITLPDGWLVLGISRQDTLDFHGSDFPTQLPSAEAAADWSELLSPEIYAMAVLSPQVAPLFSISAKQLLTDLAAHDSWLTVLLPWEESPSKSIRADGIAESFCCSKILFSNFLKVRPDIPIERLCFKIIDAHLNGILEIRTLLVRQLGKAASGSNQTVQLHDAALIMAHRGPQKYLAAALNSISHLVERQKITVRVGLDLADTNEYCDLPRTFPEVEFYVVEDAPVGPYVIRQSLIELSREHFVVFHDSDDVSCQDRFVRQASEIVTTGAEMVGSHELRVDELTGTVQAFRFPLDASAALAQPGSTEHNDRSSEPLLHPTVTMTRSGFLRAGGLSTNRRIANDTQFMLRAYFSLKMRNVDEFLYIRRRHSHALTVESRTALGSSLRHYLGSTWGADFEAVKKGTARLEETSLARHLEPVPHRLIRI